MATMFVRHGVNDYAQWKRVYDDFASHRKDHGVTGATVLRDPNDSNTVMVIHEFGDMNAALAFANSADLKSAMQNAGVSGPPEIWFGEEVEHTAH